MTGKHWNYLTNAYVEAMNMEQFPLERRDPVVVFVPEVAPFPFSMLAFDICVVYNHALYVREADGKAWSRR